MKIVSKITLSVLAASTLFLAGCNNSAEPKKQEVVKPTISAEQLSYRNTSLDDEKNTVTPGAKYSDAQPGQSKKIKRAFQDAPPMIPHSVEGMLPITKNNNQCVTCHVDSAPYDKTIPSVPVSHFTNFRPDSKAIKGVNTSSEKLENVSIKKLNHLYQGRFNCSQCHAPQATNVKLVTDNKFTPEYTSKDGAFKSSWDDTKFMEDIDTTK